MSKSIAGNKNIRTYKMRIKDKKFKSKVIDYIYKYRHFENMYIILLNQDYKQNIGDFRLLTNYEIMRALFRGTAPKKLEEKLTYIRNKYKNHQIMNDLINLSKELKIHNIVEIIKRVKSQYKGFFSKIKKGDYKAKPPKPKKLSKLTNYTIPLDSYKGFSLKRKNQLGINLNNKMIRTYINHKELEKVVGNLKNIKAVHLNFSNSELYLLFIYEKEEKEIKEKPYKSAGIDIGINNLLSIYVDDKDAPSLIIDGKKFKTYNANFNRFIAKLNREIMTTKDKNRKRYLEKYRTYLYEKRNRYFYDQFHKISKRVLEYLEKHDVTEIILSDNLNNLKNNGKCRLNKANKQNFIQIPFGKLIRYIEYKAKEYGIEVKYVDESYTSKVSSLTEDIKIMQKLLQYNLDLTNALNGKRVKRGLFKDKVINKIINADLNGARNICILGSKKAQQRYKAGGENRWLNLKLCNPIKVESDFELCRIIKSA
ncbi:RNA-guided endonuclease TnpB family protein [Caloranaerobacter azorensis]|uniref:IS200/IS605 family element transposase accessory protein TnpB n=1 Tax=Caloranaerobacter azorensis TaxID=116090 RepID=A0A6P1YEW9_9FIRM|nr:RNA-guided endonuclease TnpB family protein [Caloranaerobacter azorensis]QIB27482.1 IS200/IS605 family element transposase accessory protein TnpB [Caloranaerobacter azorensis]